MLVEEKKIRKQERKKRQFCAEFSIVHVGFLTQVSQQTGERPDQTDIEKYSFKNCCESLPKEILLYTSLMGFPHYTHTHTPVKGHNIYGRS